VIVAALEDVMTAASVRRRNGPANLIKPILNPARVAAVVIDAEPLDRRRPGALKHRTSRAPEEKAFSSDVP
jgi:hypothetical protein